MFSLIHEMRTRIITSPSFTPDHVLTTTLSENTTEQKIGDKLTADYLWEEKGIILVLKVDKGLAEEADGVRLMKPIPGLNELLGCVVERHIFGTKMRPMIRQANPTGIRKIVDQQFETGLRVAASGPAPVLKPEIDIYNPDKAEPGRIMKDEIREHLAELSEDIKLMLKLSIPDKHGFYNDLTKDSHMVHTVVLSDGYSRQETNKRLSRSPELTASFSRALSEGPNANQIQSEFDRILTQPIKEVYEASIT